MTVSIPKPTVITVGFGSRLCENACDCLIVWIVAGTIMKRIIEGEARTQVTLLPECLDDYVAE